MRRLGSVSIRHLGYGVLREISDKRGTRSIANIEIAIEFLNNLQPRQAAAANI